MKPKNSKNVPVTAEMLFGVRDELSAKIAGQSARTTGLSKRIDSLELRIDSLEAKIDGLEARIDGLEARIDSLEAKIDEKFELLKGEVHAIRLLVEQQNANNRYVLEGYAYLYDRQEKLEDRHLKFEQALNAFILSQKEN